MIAYGPVPSRRLGQSLGINNIPPKICSYSCVYCQLGRTEKGQVDRMAFYDPQKVFKDVQDKVQEVKQNGETIDYLTFVADGEPTLDIHLGREIELLKPLGIKIAVITNASLIWREDVREALKRADWVSLKIDAKTEKIWRRMNRPHKALDLKQILNGALKFAKHYRGELTTETMLVKGVNDTDAYIKRVTDFLTRLKPDKAYLAIPTRPPAEKWVQFPGETVVNRAFQILKKRLNQVEYLRFFSNLVGVIMQPIKNGHRQLDPLSRMVNSQSWRKETDDVQPEYKTLFPFLSSPFYTTIRFRPGRPRLDRRRTGCTISPCLPCLRNAIEWNAQHDSSCASRLEHGCRNGSDKLSLSQGLLPTVPRHSCGGSGFFSPVSASYQTVGSIHSRAVQSVDGGGSCQILTWTGRRSRILTKLFWKRSSEPPITTTCKYWPWMKLPSKKDTGT